MKKTAIASVYMNERYKYEWATREEGSFEDNKKPEDHVFRIIERSRKNKIDAYSQEELTALVCSGSGVIWNNGEDFSERADKAIMNVCARLNSLNPPPMTNLHSLTQGFFCVELPEGAKDIHIDKNTIWWDAPDDEVPNSWELDFIDLPAGTWSFLGMASDVGEEVAGGIVEVGRHPVYGKCYRNYQFDESKPENDHGNPRYYRYATTALTSKIRSLGIEPKRAGIIQKVNKAATA